MFHKRHYLIWLLLWGLAIDASLMIFFIPGDYAHSLCGPWGCYPELQPLAALHMAWLAGILLPTVLAARSLPLPWARLLGWTITALGAIGLAAVTCREALTWLRDVPEEWRVYFPLRLVYTVIMLTDAPLLQLVIAGVVACVLVRRRNRAQRRQATIPTPGPVAEQLAPGLMNGPNTINRP
jgi:hypothetical protein